MNTEIGRKIYVIRMSNCLTQSEFAKKLGTHTETVCRWETGVSVPSLKFIRKIAETFDVDASILTKSL